MLVSIIIPVFKVEEYIERCLRSVFTQSYKSIEIILVNDCTPDNSMIVVDRLVDDSKEVSRVRVVEHPVNRGLSVARNTGINIAEGEYLFFLDSDDELPIDAIEELVKMVEKYNGVDLVQGNFEFVPKGWFEFWKLDELDLPDYIVDMRWLTKSFFARDIFPTMSCNRLIRREWVVENKLYFKEGIIHEDECWNFFILKFLKSFSYTRSKTYLYYKNGSSITNQCNSEISTYNSYKIIIKEWVDNVTSQNKDLQVDYIFKTSFDLFEKSNYREFRLLEALFPLFYFKLSSIILNRIVETNKISQSDVRIILWVLRIEKFFLKHKSL